MGALSTGEALDMVVASELPPALAPASPILFTVLPVQSAVVYSVLRNCPQIEEDGFDRAASLCNSFYEF